MPERLWRFVKEWRDKGVDISDEEADSIYRYCLRKMDAARVNNTDDYIDLLYPDEIKDYLFRLSVNATSMLRIMRMEAIENVYGMQKNTMSSPVS